MKAVVFCLFIAGVQQLVSSTQPVVIDTDIGSDIDDTFAIVFALQSRLLDVKLILTCSENTTARAKITAKLLTLVGRDDIPIGIGVPNDHETWHTLYDWAKDFDLSTYKGGVFSDGVGKMAEVINQSSSTVDIIAIGPMTNFPTLITKYPEVVAKANIKAMAGSVYKGYDNSNTPAAEYNVFRCPDCMQKLLDAKWNSIVLTPLDTCGITRLSVDLMDTFISGQGNIPLALSSQLLYFCISKESQPCDLTERSPVFFDAVATLLCLPQAQQFAVFKDVKLKVTSDGHTRVDDSGVEVSAALEWQSDGLQQYLQFLTTALSGMQI